MKLANAIKHEKWDFAPFDAGVATADGPLPAEESAILSDVLPTIEYAQITLEQQELIDELRRQLGDIVPKPRNDHHMHTDFYLARYLVARNWDVDAARDMFETAMKWREDNDIDNIIEKFEKSEYYDLIMKYWPCSVHRDWDFWSFDNAWVVYQRLGLMDPRLVDRVPMEAVIDYHKYVVEVVEKKHAKIVHRVGFSPGGIVIEDLTGLGYQHMHKKAIEIIAMIAHIDDNYYPAILRKFYILNAPYVFTAFWSIIKKFLNKRTASKFEEQNEALLRKIVPEKYIPQYLGGSSEFPMPVGGPSENVKVSIPVNHRAVKITAGQSYKHPLEVTKPGTISWEFSVKHHDINFFVARQAEDGEEVVVETIAVESGDKKTIGSHVVLKKDVGTYYLVWDNRHSYFRSKEVFFHLSITDMPEEQ